MPELKIYWWDEKGYGSWAFVLAASEEDAWKLLEESAKKADEDQKRLNREGVYENSHFHERNIAEFRRINSLQIIEPGNVQWGEFA